MLNKLKKYVGKYLVNIPGWRINRKIVVFESDDWGSIRMRSSADYHYFLKKGFAVDQCPYNRNDALESNADLEGLFDVLTSVSDKNDNHAKFTANNIVANPDFEKIKADDFQSYAYEPFITTLTRYPRREIVTELYNQGIENQIFKPQFHGREHLNVNRWMDQLNQGATHLHEAFDRNMFTVHKEGVINGRNDNLDSFGLGFEKNWIEVHDSIHSGLSLFHSIWGFNSDSFIAPCYVWHPDLENLLAKNGIKYIQGTHVQRVPDRGKKNKISRKYHYLGQKNKFGQNYLIRNVFFEPAEYPDVNTVGNAMKEIENAFKYKKPAIISSHRVNYIGSIREKNRSENLKLLEKLLKTIINKYPDVEFMFSDELGDLIKREY
jgi:hypothetical protein